MGEYHKRIMYSNIQLTSQKSSAYVTFCFILTVVYFSSIAYNLSVADNIESDFEDNGDNPEETVPRKHREDVSMTEYVQLKLRRLSTKPWNEMMRSSLVRNYLLLFGLLFIFVAGLLFYAIYKQYLQLKSKTDSVAY